MSWEAWGSDESVDIDQLYNRGWESDSDCDKWWKAGEPETVYTMAEAIQAYEDWLYAED
jgi:hypothetical protein